MKRFIGKNTRYIDIDDGAPVNAFDLPDGRRAFQYLWGGGTCVVPHTTRTRGRVQLVGNTAYHTEREAPAGGLHGREPRVRDHLHRGVERRKKRLVRGRHFQPHAGSVLSMKTYEWTCPTCKTMLWDFDRPHPDGPWDGVLDGGSHTCRQCGGQMECTRMLDEHGLRPIPPIVPLRRWERAFSTAAIWR